MNIRKCILTALLHRSSYIINFYPNISLCCYYAYEYACLNEHNIKDLFSPLFRIKVTPYFNITSTHLKSLIRTETNCQVMKLIGWRKDVPNPLPIYVLLNPSFNSL